MNQKETLSPSRRVAIMALLAALDAVFSLLSSFFPFSAFFLMLVVPFTAAVAAFLLPLRYLPLFVLIAFSACMGCSFWDFQNTLFYTLPSLIVGALFGVFTIKKIPEDCGVFLLCLLECLLFGGSLFLIYLIYGVSMEEVLLALLHLEKNAYLSHVFPLFCLTYSYAQMALTYLSTRLLLDRLRFPFQAIQTPRWVGFAFCLLFTLLSLTAFLWPTFGYFFLGALVYWVAQTSIHSFPYARKWAYVLLGLGIFLGMLLFALFYSACPGDTGLGLVLIPLFFVALSNFLSAPLIETKIG